ncbi:MAG: hypothetical protein AABX98_02915 [Nanoarchaeota archaeon]
MKIYGYYTGTYQTSIKGTKDLENDLIALVKKYSGIMAYESVVTAIGSDGTRNHSVRLYEIPEEGAMHIIISDRRVIKPMHAIDSDPARFNGTVSCLGFDERHKFFGNLHHDLEALTHIYHGSRH